MADRASNQSTIRQTAEWERSSDLQSKTTFADTTTTTFAVFQIIGTVLNAHGLLALQDVKNRLGGDWLARLGPDVLWPGTSLKLFPFKHFTSTSSRLKPMFSG